MKSCETQIRCPVCRQLVSAENINKHLAQRARLEQLYNLQDSKKHYNYYENKTTSGVGTSKLTRD